MPRKPDRPDAPHVIRWTFHARPGRETEFEAAYGPEGPWVTLFRRAPGYLGTTLQRLPGRPGWYETVDVWGSAASYAAFRQASATEYEELDAACEALTLEEVPSQP